MKEVLTSILIIAIATLSCLHLDDAFHILKSGYQAVVSFLAGNVQIPTI